MTWQPLTDIQILKALRPEELVATRTVMLAEVGKGTQVEQHLDQDWGAASTQCDQIYSVSAYGTDPATVVLTDDTNRSVLAVYVWKGRGGPITGSRDERLIKLIDSLENEFDGSDTPIHWETSECSCSACGTSFTPQVPGGKHTTEAHLEDGTRAAFEKTTYEELALIIGQNATEKQWQKIEECLDLGCQPGDVMNIRFRGGGAIGAIVVCLTTPDGILLEVWPDGEVRAEM
ncbi:MAG: hypothetical protein AAGA25_08160 [Planctomycetota bacterium]